MNKERVRERPINTFKIGTIVSVYDVFEFQKVTIEYITEGCTTVSGPHCNPHTTLSCNCPAHLYDPNEVIEKPIIDIVVDDKKVEEALNKIDNDKVVNEKPSDKIKRLKGQIDLLNKLTGNKVTKVAKNPVIPNSINFQFPPQPFTIKEFAEFNNLIDIISTRNWLEFNCTRAGSRETGKRGKPPALYKVK